MEKKEYMPKAEIWTVDTISNEGLFCEEETNHLFKVNMLKKECTLICKLSSDIRRPYCICKQIDYKIFCFPGKSNCIAIVNIQSKTIKHIILFENYIGELLINEIWEYKNCIYFLISITGELCILDVEKEKIIFREKIDNHIDELKFDSIRVENDIFYVSNNIVYSFNLDVPKVNRLIQRSYRTLDTIAYCCKRIWISAEGKELLEFDIKGNLLNTYNIPYVKELSFDEKYFYSLTSKEKIYLIKSYSAQIHVFDTLNKSWHSINIYEGETEINVKDKIKNLFNFPIYCNKNRIGFYCSKKEMVYELDTDNEEFQISKYYIDSCSIKKMYEKRNIFYERKRWDWKAFIALM